MSLSSIKQKKEWSNSHKKQETETLVLRTTPFNIKELLFYWNNYQKIKIKNGELNIASLLQLSIPKLEEENLIHFHVSNSLNKIELEREFTTFIPYLKEQLKNDILKIEIKIVTSTKGKNLYFSKEKYNRLKEINPAIEQLKKVFKLNID